MYEAFVFMAILLKSEQGERARRQKKSNGELVARVWAVADAVQTKNFILHRLLNILPYIHHLSSES